MNEDNRLFSFYRMDKPCPVPVIAISPHPSFHRSVMFIQLVQKKLINKIKAEFITKAK